jgi:hypothetical protein
LFFNIFKNYNQFFYLPCLPSVDILKNVFDTLKVKIKNGSTHAILKK